MNEDFNKAVPFVDQTNTVSTVDFVQEMNKEPVPSPEVAQERANKISFALGEMSPGEDTLYESIIQGNIDVEQKKYAAIERQENLASRQRKIDGIITTARQKGMGITPEDIEEIRTLSDPEVDHISNNPDTYFQKKYSQRLIDEAIKPFIIEEERPDTKALEDFVAKRTIADELSQYAQLVFSGTPTLGKAYSFATTFIPYIDEYRTHDAIKDLPGSPLFMGDNLKAQIEHAYKNMSVDEFRASLKNAIDNMDPLTAIHFSKAFSEYSASDEFSDNFFTGLEVASTIGFAPTGVTASLIRGVRKGGKVATTTEEATQAIKAAKAGAKAANRPGATIVDVLDASGQTEAAAVKIAAKEINRVLNPEKGARAQSFSELKDNLPLLFNPGRVAVGIEQSSFSGEAANRIVRAMLDQSKKLVRAGLDTVNINRLAKDSNASRVAFQEAEKLFRIQYPDAADGILQVNRVHSSENPATNTSLIAVQLGKTTGTLFDDIESAMNTAKKLYKFRQFNVKAQGGKYYIEVTKAVDETSPSVKRAIEIDTDADPTPSSMVNKFLGWFRPRDSVVSKDINKDVKVATFGTSKLNGISQAIMDETFKELPRWRNSSRKDFQKYLNYEKLLEGPDGKPGRTAADLAEFEDGWREVFNRLPTEQEAKAYFTYHQVQNSELMLNVLNIYKGKHSEGLEHFFFKKEGLELGPEHGVEAKILDKMPWDIPGDAGILYWPREAGAKPQYLRRKFLSKETMNMIDEGIEQEGYRVFRLSRYGQQTLMDNYKVEGMPNGRVRYIIARDYESTPLPLQQLPNRPGSHLDFLEGFYISQPNIHAGSFSGQKFHDYFGDVNIFMARTEREAKEFSQIMEEARRLRFDQKAPKLARAYLKSKGLPWSYGDFRKQFKDRGGILDPKLPIMWRARGTSLNEQYDLAKKYVNWDDSTSAHDIEGQNLFLRHAQERELPMQAVANVGDADHPIFDFRPARTLDATAALSRAVSQVTRGRLLDDLKIKAMNRFQAEFSKFLLPEAREHAKHYPFKALVDGKFNDNHPDTVGLAAARQYRRSMLEFLSIKDEDTRRVDTIIHKTAQRVFDLLGRDRGEKVMDWVEPHMASTIKDPTRFLRSVAFYPRMGFFNIKQLFLQGLGVVHTAAIEGLDRSLHAFGGAWLMSALRYSGDPEVIEGVARKAESLGWKKQHFIESFNALQRVGFDNVGGETANLDASMGHNVVRGGWGRFLDGGLYFFRTGERYNRMTAWNASYLRWRHNNPLKVFDDEAVAEVLERADMLSMNMSRASNAGWNSGWASIPTQFWSYSGRLTDQMLGNRLTGKEKLRVMATYSALFGAPMGVLGTTLGAFWPVHQETRKQLMAAGYQVDDLAWTAFLEGIPQAMIKWASGGEVEPNFAELFGPNGLQSVRDFFSGEKSVAEVATGASGITTMNLLRGGYLASEALLTDLWGLTTGDQTVYKMTFNDFVPLLENVSSLNQGMKAYYAYTLGTYFLKNRIDVVDDGFSKGNALFTALLGTTPQAVADSYTKQQILRSTKEAQRHSRTEAIRYIRMSLDKDISDEDRLIYLRRANAYFEAGGFTSTSRVGIIKEAMEGKENEVDRLDERLRKSTIDRLNADLERRAQQ